MNYIAIDIGSSNIKIIETNEKLNIINKAFVEKDEVEKVLIKFIKKNNINIKNIEQIVLTGIGAYKVADKILNIPTIKVDEFMAIGSGLKYLSGNKKSIIANIGTGTSFIKLENNKYMHIGGTGVGGGTLLNLCKYIKNDITFEEIYMALEKGNLDNVDLKIKDITINKIETLPENTTAANFGKLNKKVANEDLIKGFANMIFEIIGVMAALIVKGENLPEVIVTGKVAQIPYAKEVLNKIEKLHNVKFEIPKNAEYITALGAVNFIRKI